MKLSELPKDRIKAVFQRVEQALGIKFTKAAVVGALSEQGLCSAKSTGIEKTLLKIGQMAGYVPPLFAKVMGVPPLASDPHPWIDKTPQPPKPAEDSLPAVPQTQATKKPERRLVAPTAFAFSMGGINLRAISIVEILNQTTKVHLRDGSTLESSVLTEELLRRNCKVVALGA